MLGFYGFKMAQNPIIAAERAGTAVSSSSDDHIDIAPSATFKRAASQTWMCRFDHNHLRISRIIRCLRVLGLDARDLPRGLARLGVDGAVYLALILGTGALRRDEVLGLVRQVRARRAARGAAPSPSEPPPSVPEERAA